MEELLVLRTRVGELACDLGEFSLTDGEADRLREDEVDIVILGMLGRETLVVLSFDGAEAGNLDEGTVTS